MTALRDEISVRLFDDVEDIHDGFFYFCGRLLSKKVVALPSLSAALSTAWGLSERVLVRQEVDDVLVFHFKEEVVKNRVLSGGPWFFNNFMLLLADYDGLSAIDAAPLHLINVWVAVKGLPMGLRSQKALARIGAELGDFGRVDPAAVHWKDVTQRVRVRMDVRRRFWPRRHFEFSSSTLVAVDLFYERCHGTCSDCGLFGHSGGTCDRLVAEALQEAGLASTVVASMPGMETGRVGESAPFMVGGDSESAPMIAGLGLGTDGCQRLVGVGGVGTELVPSFSTPNPNLKLGLTGSGSNGLGFSDGLVIFGPQDSNLKENT